MENLITKKQITIDGDEFYIDLCKKFDFKASSGKKYYVYKCDIYEQKELIIIKRTLFKKHKIKQNGFVSIFSFKTKWSKYFDYYG